MDRPKVYLLWAVGVGGVALVLGVCASGMLVLALRGLIPMPPWLWVLARCLVVMQCVCLVAAVVLMAMGLSGRFRGWVVGGMRGWCGGVGNRWGMGRERCGRVGNKMFVNRLCKSCRHVGDEPIYDGCRHPDRRAVIEAIETAVSNTDGSINWEKKWYYYGNATLNTEPHPLPCFEPRAKAGFLRLVGAIAIALVLAPLFAFGFLLVAHLGFSGVGFPPLPWFIVGIGVAVGVAGGIAVGRAWYRREL